MKNFYCSSRPDDCFKEGRSIRTEARRKPVDGQVVDYWHSLKGTDNKLTEATQTKRKDSLKLCATTTARSPVRESPRHQQERLDDRLFCKLPEATHVKTESSPNDPPEATRIKTEASPNKTVRGSTIVKTEANPDDPPGATDVKKESSPKKKASQRGGHQTATSSFPLFLMFVIAMIFIRAVLDEMHEA